MRGHDPNRIWNISNNVSRPFIGAYVYVMTPTDEMIKAQAVAETYNRDVELKKRLVAPTPTMLRVGRNQMSKTYPISNRDLGKAFKAMIEQALKESL